ncbi:MAG: DUF1992 domain-containing protein [Bacillus sp. (in: Bacteria)]|nr:DUF1992 domain-containing protein [Bacillus sp. (in: firmicutes)]
MSRDLIGDMLKAKEKDVLYEKPKGFGKPLSREVLEGDVLDRTVKNAGFLPEWIKLQQEIRDQLSKVVSSMEGDILEESISQQIDEINQKVKKYNRICPTKMQKMLITWEQAAEQLKSWS